MFRVQLYEIMHARYFRIFWVSWIQISCSMHVVYTECMNTFVIQFLILTQIIILEIEQTHLKNCAALKSIVWTFFILKSYQANFASSHTCDRHVGFLLPCDGTGKNNKIIHSFLSSSYTTLPNYNWVTRILVHILD